MSINAPNRMCPSRRRWFSRGSVLVWLLLVVGVLMVVVVAFLTRTSAIERRAQDGRVAAAAEWALDGAVAEFMAKLDDGFQVEGPDENRRGHVAAAPGLLQVRRYDTPPNRGRALGAAAFSGASGLSAPFARDFDGAPANPRLIPLFSHSVLAPRLPHLSVVEGAPARPNPDYNPTVAFNLNTRRNPFIPGRPLLSAQSGEPAAALAARDSDGRWLDDTATTPPRLLEGQSSAERPVWVQWIPVHENPGEPGGSENRIVARYAYWADLDNTRLRLDQPLTPLREHPAYPLVLGDTDAAVGSGSRMAQSADHPHRRLRERASALLPFPFDAVPPLANTGVPEPAIRRMWSGARGSGFAPLAARYARDSWFDWGDSRTGPLAGGVAAIDWDFFNALRPRGAGERLGLDDRATSASHRWSSRSAEMPGEPAAALREVLGRSEQGLELGARQQAARDMAEAFLEGSATFSGYDDERDPLGRRKIDLALWQLDVTGGRTQTVDPARIQSSELWRRLGDTGYYRALFPGAWPRGGTPASFHESWNSFAADGASASLQLLVNLAEAAQPPAVAPLIDEVSGLVGARSMPYVAEVATRARSALWRVPVEVRDAWLERARAGDLAVAVESWGGRSMAEWAGLVEADLSFGLVNVDPFSGDRFRGVLEVDLTWHQLPPRAEVNPGPFRAELDGTYATTVAPGSVPTKVRVTGRTVWFPLGLVPGWALDATSSATCLRIEGWRLYRLAEDEDRPVLWHKVPVRHPGGGPPRPWWAMAQPGVAAGHWDDTSSLAAYRDPVRPDHAASVGWFTSVSGRRLQPGALFLPASVFAGQAGLSSADEVENHRQLLRTWGEVSLWTARMDTVFCEDPVVGHRTGDDSAHGRFGHGHFYGARGHAWRRVPMDALERMPAFGYVPPLPWQTSHEFKAVALGDSDVGPARRIAQIAVPVTRVAGWERRSTASTVGVALAEPRFGSPMGGRYFTSTQIAPVNAAQAIAPEPPDSLCGLLAAPALTGPLPQGDPRFDLMPEKPPASVPWLRNVDLEPPAGIEPSAAPIDTLEHKKGPRSLLSHAPPGRPFLSLGEMGFVHSGFPGHPILVGPDEGRTPWQLNTPLHGTPMRLLLDLFTPPVLTTASGSISREDFLAGRHPARRPPGSAVPNRAAWNVNTTPAHDEYLALRQGGRTELESDVRDDKLTGTAPVHAVWLPGASGFSRREVGSEAFRGRSLEDHLKKKPGYPLDRHLSPFPRFPRPWAMWLHLVAGDPSDARSAAGDLWGPGNALVDYFGPGTFTWQPGRGAGPPSQPWVDFDPRSPGTAVTLTFGTDARHNERNSDDNVLRGRHSADQHLGVLARPPHGYVPLEQATRFSLFPLRHFMSDLAVSFNATAEFADLRTALNPRLHPGVLAGATAGPDGVARAVTVATAKKWDGTGFPGGAHSSGVFYHAPMALLTPYADISANAFTLYAVAQAVKDTGRPRDGIPHSGPGEIDPDDEVVAEVWLRITIEREPGSSPPRWRMARREVRRGAG